MSTAGSFVSDILGYASLACWLIAQFPQVFENIRRQSCDGIALSFLLNWFLGDTSNLIGCFLTHQLPFQTYLAAYFVFIDFVVLLQYFYYDREPKRILEEGVKKSVSPVARRTPSKHVRRASGSSRRRGSISIAPSRGHASQDVLPETEILTPRKASVRSAGMVLLGTSVLFGVGKISGQHTLTTNTHIGSVISTTAVHLASASQPSNELIIGRIFAWICATLYFTSRLPQIYKNFTRKSVEGLSISLFVFAFFGNLFYVASILLSPELSGPASTAFIRESVPYLIGSGGTLLFDVAIVTQSYIYRPTRGRKSGEEESLLRGHANASTSPTNRIEYSSTSQTG